MRILHDLLLNPEASIFCLFCKNKQPKLICRRQKSTTALRRLNTQKIEKKCDVIYEKITRKQMVELIIQQYTPENIVDVCTVK